MITLPWAGSGRLRRSRQMDRSVSSVEAERRKATSPQRLTELARESGCDRCVLLCEYSIIHITQKRMSLLPQQAKGTFFYSVILCGASGKRTKRKRKNAVKAQSVSFCRMRSAPKLRRQRSKGSRQALSGSNADREKASLPKRKKRIPGSSEERQRLD